MVSDVRVGEGRGIQLYTKDFYVGNFRNFDMVLNRALTCFLAMREREVDMLGGSRSCRHDSLMISISHSVT